MGFPWPTVMILDMGKIMGFSLWAEWLSSIRMKGRCSFVELTELCRNTTSCNSKRNSVPLRTLCSVKLPDKSWTYGYSAVLCGTINQQEVMVMSEMHLDLTDLLDQDISSFEYFPVSYTHLTLPRTDGCAATARPIWISAALTNCRKL